LLLLIGAILVVDRLHRQDIALAVSHACMAIVLIMLLRFANMYGGRVIRVENPTVIHGFGPMLLIPLMSMVALIFRCRVVVALYAVIASVTYLICVFIYDPPSPAVAADTSYISNSIFVIASIIFSSICLMTLLTDERKAARSAVESAAALETVNAQLEEARSASTAKTRFVSIMSHEVRSPLQSILLNVEMVSLTQLSSPQAEYIRSIEESSKLLLLLVADVLDVARINAGSFRLDEQPFSMREMAESVIVAVAPTAARKQLDVTLEVPAKHSGFVVGDATRVHQVLRNLVSNAVKYTPSGSVEVRLSVDEATVTAPSVGGEQGEEEEKGGAPLRRWHLTVVDTGPGIDEAKQACLFQEFSQVGETTDGEGSNGGSGLGLFLVKKLSELMGGSTAVQSMVGVGSTFSATLLLADAPRARSDSKLELMVPAAQRAAARWTVVVAARSETLRSSLAALARRCLGSPPSLYVTEAPSADALISTLSGIVACGPQPKARILVILDVALARRAVDETMVTVRRSHGAWISTLLVGWPLATDDRVALARRGWTHIVEKPVTIGRLVPVLSSLLEGGGAGNLIDDGDRPHEHGKHRSPRSTTASASAIPSPLAPSPQSPLVVIVDADDTSRSLLCHLITALGYRTDACHDGLNGLSTIRSHYQDISLVLLAADMPVLGGPETLGHLRQLEDSLAVPPADVLPVVVMSVDTTAPTVRRLTDLGVAAVIGRPVRRTDVAAALAAHVRQVGEKSRSPATRRPPGRRQRARRGRTKSPRAR
jgi:signal transduction histidine kinase/CheY-like chemotaxis protein